MAIDTVPNPWTGMPADNAPPAAKRVKPESPPPGETEAIAQPGVSRWAIVQAIGELVPKLEGKPQEAALGTLGRLCVGERDAAILAAAAKVAGTGML